MEYLISRFTASSPFKDLLSSTSSPNSKNRIALVVSERLINLPVQIMPPMWKMTIDEVEKAQKEVNAIDGFLGPCRDDTNPGHLSYNE
jgi:protein BCP1